MKKADVSDSFYAGGAFVIVILIILQFAVNAAKVFKSVFWAAQIYH